MNNDTNKIAKNYLYNLIYQIFCFLVPLVTTPYISRVLGAEKIGIYSYTLSVSTYFIVAGNSGFPLYGQREIAYCSNDIKKRSEKFFEITVIRSICLLCALTIYCMLCVFFFKDNKSIYWAQLIGIIANIIDFAWFFQGLEEFKTLVLRNFLIKILAIIGLFVFVKNQSHLLIYTIIMGSANLWGNVFLFVKIKKYIIGGSYKIDFRTILKLMSEALILGIPYYITSIYAVLDKTMLGYISGNFKEVGFYEQSQKIITFALTIVTSVGTVFLPRLAREFKNSDEQNAKRYLDIGTEITIMLSCPIMIGLFIIAPIIVPWFFGEGYGKVGVLIEIFAPMVLVMGIGNLIGNQYLIATQREKLLILSIILGVIINCSLNYIWIPKYDSIGAALATVFSEIVKMIFQLYWVRKDVSVKKILKNFENYIWGSIIMGGIIWALREKFFDRPTFENTGILVLIGFFIYGAYILAKNKKWIKIHKM